MSADHSTMKVYFPIKPEVEIHADDRWMVANTFHIVVEEKDKDDIVIDVFQGSMSDGPSVPRMPFVYLMYGGIGLAASIVHDDLYRQAIYPREWCDAVFYHGLLATGVPENKAQAMYAAVQKFGESHYNQGDST